VPAETRTRAGNLDALATALYAATDELLRERSDLAPWRPSVGIAPQLTEAAEGKEGYSLLSTLNI
jgi:hypothetical protein